MHRLVALPAAGAMDAGGVDDDFRPFDGRSHRIRISQIRLDRMNLAHGARWLEVACKVGAPHRSAHPPSPTREGAHDMASDEARAPENRYKPIAGLRIFDHES